MDFENVRERNRHGDDQDMQKVGVEKYRRLTSELTAETSRRYTVGRTGAVCEKRKGKES